MEVYLDNCATTPLYEEVIEYMGFVQSRYYGNASSIHGKGLETERLINLARSEVAGALGVEPAEVVFTSGGTESNNMAIKGIARRHHRRGKHIITTPIEHPSSLYACLQLEKEGFVVSFAGVDEKGQVVLQRLEEMITPQTTLVNIIHVNNEIGTVQDIAAIGHAIKKINPRAIFHVDAVQSFGKVPLDPLGSMVDALSISAHKIHGPKGTGALWLKKGIDIQPLLQGGDQERGLRPGTENQAGIAGFGKAVSIYFARRDEHIKKMKELKVAFAEKLNGALPVRINGPSLHEGAPHVLNLCFGKVRGEVLTHALEEDGIHASPGSACHSRRPEPSHVLEAIGLDEQEIRSSLRFSFSPLNTAAGIEYAARKIVEKVRNLQEIMM
ncbi:MAG: cysteine desulfurase [Firmicutes bacterium]|jgi:cysteine desulfurase|nr:cysteine desulfurase [Bacillota bacterium]